MKRGALETNLVKLIRCKPVLFSSTPKYCPKFQAKLWEWFWNEAGLLGLCILQSYNNLTTCFLKKNKRTCLFSNNEKLYRMIEKNLEWSHLLHYCSQLREILSQHASVYPAHVQVGVPEPLTWHFAVQYSPVQWKETPHKQHRYRVYQTWVG